ncbi:MAG: DUF2905 family protein [Pirellulales bacterium]
MRSTFSIGLALLCVLGLAIGWQFQSALPQLGSLPGDLVVNTNEVRLYVPLGSTLFLLLALNGCLWGFRKLA